MSHRRTRFGLALGLALAMFAGTAQAQIDVVVSYADDSLERDPGIYHAPNVARVTPGSFASLKFLMRPMTLTAPGFSGDLVLESIADPIVEVYRTDGTRVFLPATFDAADLPIDVLVNVTGAGEGALNLRQGAERDRVRIRASHFPGVAGRELSDYPFFEQEIAVSEDGVVQTALDPVRHAERVGLMADVYIVRHRPAEQWALTNVLVDASGSFETTTVTAGGIQDNVVDAWTTGLDGEAGTSIGAAYDVVYDFGMDGTLDPGDIVDGFRYTPSAVDAAVPGVEAYDQAGFYIVEDLTQPGPFSTANVFYSGGTFLGQKTFYPTNIDELGQVPLIVISHGNGHQYTWYDYLQSHLASYGYIVMSHQNNTVPGPETASTTTLLNTDYLIANQNTIAGGVLGGHIDNTRIMWIGHSRGGEGVARAYDRIFDGAYSPGNYEIEALKCVSSIAPTDFLGTDRANPHGVTYHMLQGAADGDVCGCPSNDIAQALHLLDRAVGIRTMTYVHGADHNDFNCCGFNDFQGPFTTQIGRPEAQRVAKAAYLALAKRYLDGNEPAKDYLWRQYEALKPIGVAGTTTVGNMYKEEGPGTETFVIDDYQTEFSTATSSSGGAVTFDVTNIFENRLNDINTDFTWTPADPMNGMTYARTSDSTRGVVFDWNTDSFMEFEIVAEERDLSDDDFVSLRACQGTRHPNTTSRLGDLTFTMTLEDAAGTTSSIEIGAYGGGLEEPYQRTGFGIGAGWQNEFETIRVRLTDFEANGSGIDLSDIVALRLEFGPSFGDTVGRIGLDDVEIYRRLPNGRQ